MFMFEIKYRENNSELYVDISFDQSLLLINRYREQFEKLLSIGLFVSFIKSLETLQSRYKTIQNIFCS